MKPYSSKDFEDFIQNVYLKILHKGNFDPEKGTLRRYLFRIVRNQLNNELKNATKINKQISCDEIHIHTTCDTELINNTIHDYIFDINNYNQDIKKERDASNLASFFISGYTIKETMEKTGFSRSRVLQARLSFREKMNKAISMGYKPSS